MMDRIWVRALVALATYLIFFVALWLLGDLAVVRGLALGKGVLYFDYLSIFAAIIIGPAWIFHRLLSAPRGGGHRAAAVVQLPVCDDADAADNGEGRDEPSAAA